MTNQTINAYAANNPKSPLQLTSFKAPPIKAEEVMIKVEYCGICHSDLSMLNNDWGITRYPFVAGHEVIGIISQLGDAVKGLKVGQRVGLGWTADSCMHCQPCMTGEHNLCSSNQATIVGRHGGFADQVSCHWAWAIPIPEALNPATAGPLLCGGITVFAPIIQASVLATHKVAVIGIGGLGHLAIQFLNKWGCEVTAFSSSPDKKAQLLELGAHQVFDSRDERALEHLQGNFDFILNTTNVDLNWQSYLNLLNANGTLHTVGVVPNPMPISAMSLIAGAKSVSGSPTGSPALTKTMLEFCARHQIEAMTEQFPFSEINQAIQHLEDGKARYRVVLKTDH